MFCILTTPIFPPLKKCPAYAKNWLMEFEEPTSAAASSDNTAVTTQDKRWVLATMVAVMALRDDSRSKDTGMVTWSVCEIETGVLLGIFLTFVILLVVTGLVFWVKLHWREATIKFLQDVEDAVLPRVVVGVGKT